MFVTIISQKRIVMGYAKAKYQAIFKYCEYISMRNWAFHDVDIGEAAVRKVVESSRN